MTKTLNLSNDLSLPMNAVTQKMGFLGISGSGKTYAVGTFVEELLEARAQVVVIDTIGNWYGLRLATGGKGPGYSIPILGGEKGDVALEHLHGKLVAETVATTKASVIIDVSDFTGGELRTFVVDFATHLLRLKKQYRSPVMVVWEECQDIVPQRVMGESAKMVGAVEKLIKKGRNYGIGTVLISQRSAAVNKDVLNQIETLFCFRQNAKHDRKAVEDWIVHRSIDVGALVNELPTLPTGVCFCWSPQWLGVLRKIRINKKRTFDASATPEFGDDFEAGELAPVDLEKFKKSMGEAIEKAKNNDPELLQRRIAELEIALNDRSSLPEIHTIEKPVISQEDIERIEGLLDKAANLYDMHAQAAQVLVSEIGNTRELLKQVKSGVVPKNFFLGQQHELPRSQKAVLYRHPRAVGKSTEISDDPKIDGGARRMLQQLAMRHTVPTTRTQLATLSGLSPGSGTYATYLSQLHTAGLVVKETNGDEATYYITASGVVYLGGDVPEAPKTQAELVELWCSKLDGRARDMLRVVVAHGKAGITRSALAEAVDMAEGSGTYATYLSALNSNRLIVKKRGLITPSSLFV